MGRVKRRHDGRDKRRGGGVEGVRKREGEGRE